MRRKNKPKRSNARARKGPIAVDWAPAFISALAETGHNDRACEAASISRTTVWERRRDDKNFADAYRQSLAISAISLEAEAVRRARDGMRRMKFNSKTGEAYIDPETGKPYIEHEYSDTLLIALLKRHYPELYKERPAAGDSSATVNVNITVMSDEKRQKLIDLKRQAIEDNKVGLS